MFRPQTYCGEKRGKDETGAQFKRLYNSHAPYTARVTTTGVAFIEDTHDTPKHTQHN